MKFIINIIVIVIIIIVITIIVIIIIIIILLLLSLAEFKSTNYLLPPIKCPSQTCKSSFLRHFHARFHARYFYFYKSLG